MKETEYTEYTLREFELTSIDDVSGTSFIWKIWYKPLTFSPANYGYVHFSQGK